MQRRAQPLLQVIAAVEPRIRLITKPLDRRENARMGAFDERDVNLFRLLTKDLRYLRLRTGSSASCKPSPSRLTAMIVTVIAIPGHAIHHPWLR